MKMEFPHPCLDGPMRPNSVHLACMTNLIISTELLLVGKWERMGLKFHWTQFKRFCRGWKTKASDLTSIFLFYFICHPVFLNLHTRFFLEFCHTLISHVKCSICARSLFLRMLSVSTVLTSSRTRNLEVLHATTLVSLRSPLEAKVMSMPAQLYKWMLLFSVFYPFFPCSLQFGTNEVHWFVMSC